MMKRAIIILIVLMFLGYKNVQDKRNNNMYVSNSKVTPEQVDTAVVIEQDNNTKTVIEIVAFIDSLYGLKKQFQIDTISNLSINEEDKAKLEEDSLAIIDLGYELGPKALDLSKVIEYYKYISFEFLIFNQRAEAKKQFHRVINSNLDNKNDSAEWDNKLYWKIFSKAGSSYILYNEMIIYHHRRCNYDEKVEIPREDKILEYLYNGMYPVEPYFVRVRCGWGRFESK
ncbi:hypothetical protein E9993_11660 [Labilibacter sediminis]|nr:hypothetical protein E9993_11660 [Labilibacter sediminis]